MLAEQNYRLSSHDGQAFADYLTLRRVQPHFANARWVRNALDRARLRQADRHVAAGVVRIDDLSVIEAADIRASRVFDAPRLVDPIVRTVS